MEREKFRTEFRKSLTELYRQHLEATGEAFGLANPDWYYYRLDEALIHAEIIVNFYLLLRRSQVYIKHRRPH